MKLLVPGLALWSAVIAQSTLLHSRVPGGVTPDLVWVLTLLAARWKGVLGGSLAGFWGGLLMGAARGQVAGPMAALYLAMGWATGAYFEARAGFYPLELGLLVISLGLTGSAAEAAWLRGVCHSALPVLGPGLLANIGLALVSLVGVWPFLSPPGNVATALS